MLLTNPYKPDPRVQREAWGLLEAGYRVSVVCWDRKSEYPKFEVNEGIQLIRIQDVPSSYGAGWRQVRYLPRVWRSMIQVTRKLKPDVVHCHDLDTLYAGWRIKQRLNCQLVYDAHEHYPAMMSLYLPRLLVWSLIKWEDWLIGKADQTITASTVLADELIDRGIKRVLTIGNYPLIDDFTNVDLEKVSKVRKSLETTGEELIVGYIGGFSRNRMLMSFIEAADLSRQVNYHLWGNGVQRSIVEQEAAKRSNVFYHGWLPFAELPEHFYALDIVYYCLRTDYVGAVYNAPNTLSQAMASGKPIIATNVGDLGRIVKDTNCGLLLEDASPVEIASTIQRLASSELRNRLGANGRMAAEEKYNAASSQLQLVQLYTELRASHNL